MIRKLIILTVYLLPLLTYSQDNYKWEQYIMYEEKGDFTPIKYNDMSNMYPDWTKIYYKGPVHNIKTNKTEIKEGYYWYFFWNFCMWKGCDVEINEYKDK